MASGAAIRIADTKRGPGLLNRLLFPLARGLSRFKWILFCCVSLVLGGCDLDEAFSPDGECVAFVLRRGQTNEKTIENKHGFPSELRIRRLDGAWKQTVPLPDPWQPISVGWLSDQVLLVVAARPDDEPKERAANNPEAQERAREQPYVYWRLEMSTGGDVRQISRTSLTDESRAFPGKYRDKPCVFARAKGEDGATFTQILDLDCVTVLGRSDRHFQPIGDGWMLYATYTINSGAHLKSMVICDPDLHVVGTISRQQMEAACASWAIEPDCAAISDDHKRVVILFRTARRFADRSWDKSLAVFSLESGNLLWGAGSNDLFGRPALIGQEVFTLEASQSKAERRLKEDEFFQGVREIDLVCSRSGERKIVCRVPLQDGERALNCYVSPDRRRFLLRLEGTPGRALMVPIGTDTKADAIQPLD